MIDLRHNNKAFALTFSLIFLFLVISFMSVYLLAVGNGTSQANRLANSKKAYYVAEAGLADAYGRIVLSGATVINTSTCNNLAAPTLASCSSPFIPATKTDNGVYAIGATNGSYVVSVQYSNNPRTNYIITSQGTYGNMTKTLQLKITSATIARYAYWSNSEINPSLGQLWWISGQLTTGPVQTNGTFNIFGNPVFDGPTAEVGPSPNYYFGTGSDPTSQTYSDPSYIFPDGGIQNNAPALNLPPPATLSVFQTAATTNGLVLTGTSTVIFNPTGNITVTGNVLNSSCQTSVAYNNTTINPPTNGVIYVQSTSTIAACKSSASDGNVTVQGTVKGQLTVAADQNVYISGNVQYNTDPQINPASTDMLGLVANQNVTIIEASAPSQLTIEAAMIALQGSFDVDQWWVNPDPLSNGLDGANMLQYGSMVNAYSGCTGVVDMSGNLYDGWNEIQAYDNRLETTSPPGFPPLVNGLGQAIYVKESPGLLECNAGICG